jgi:hypothetical protein
VLRLLGELETLGRMTRLLVEVDDPLHLARPAEERVPLLLGAFVEVEFEGRAPPGLVEIERTWLRHGDVVWVVGPEDRLEIRAVGVAFRGAERVLVRSGLAPGDRVVTSDLGTPVEGMLLRPEPDAEVAGSR